MVIIDDTKEIFINIDNNNYELIFKLDNKGKLTVRIYTLKEINPEKAQRLINDYFSVSQYDNKYYEPCWLTRDCPITAKKRTINWKSATKEIDPSLKSKVEEIAKTIEVKSINGQHLFSK